MEGSLGREKMWKLCWNTTQFTAPLVLFLSFQPFW